jgi:hypothetical protein
MAAIPEDSTVDQYDISDRGESDSESEETDGEEGNEAPRKPVAVPYGYRSTC